MKKKSKFSAFGVNYRTEQFSAVNGLALLAKKGDLHPCEILSMTEVEVNGKWKSLADQNILNKYVEDKAKVLVPRVVLNGILSLVHDFNFEFVSTWKAAKIPARFISGAKTVESKNVDPMITQLIQDGVATLKELEEYYSLEDAFKMFDALTIRGINEALANEAAMNKSNKR